MSVLFETRRLFVRELQETDLQAFYDLQSNPAVMKFVGKSPMDHEACTKDLMQLMNHYREQENGFWVWAVCVHESNELIGTCAIVMSEKGNEIGYRLREKFWGNAYGVEITKGLIGYAFDQLNLDHLFAEVDQLNAHSVAILDAAIGGKKPFWNEESQTNDYYYKLSKNDYDQIRYKDHS